MGDFQGPTVNLPEDILQQTNIAVENPLLVDRFHGENHFFFWLVVTGKWLEHDFPYIGNVIIPTDELHHFSEG